MVAVDKDENNKMIPIEYNSWQWFLKLLLDDLQRHLTQCL